MPYVLTSLAGALLQSDTGDSGPLAAMFSTIYLLCCLLPMLILVVAGLWKMFVKAGKPGWAAIIPFYNYWVAFEISGRPGWWMFGLLIPILNIIVMAVLCYDLARSYGKGMGTALGLYFLPMFFMLWLGWGDAAYVGPAAAPSVAPPPAA